jgi:hypothetical protein
LWEEAVYCTVIKEAITMEAVKKVDIDKKPNVKLSRMTLWQNKKKTVVEYEPGLLIKIYESIMLACGRC